MSTKKKVQSKEELQKIQEESEKQQLPADEGQTSVCLFTCNDKSLFQFFHTTNFSQTAPNPVFDSLKNQGIFLEKMLVNPEKSVII